MADFKTNYNGMNLEFINLKDINKTLVVAHKYYNGKNVYNLMPNTQLKTKVLSKSRIVKKAYKNIINECNLLQTFHN